MEEVFKLIGSCGFAVPAELPDIVRQKVDIKGERTC